MLVVVSIRGFLVFICEVEEGVILIFRYLFDIIREKFFCVWFCVLFFIFFLGLLSIWLWFVIRSKSYCSVSLVKFRMVIVLGWVNDKVCYRLLYLKYF